MKKTLLVFLMVLCLLPTASIAASKIDLSTLTFDELVALKDSINLAIWNSEEWQEVTVPQGVYEIGVDIPAGHWTIMAADGANAYISWGTKLDETKKSLDAWNSDFYESQALVSKTYDYYDEKDDVSEIDYELSEKQYLIIESGSVVFVPYNGKPGLGFK